jgi:hypothetical protein
LYPAVATIGVGQLIQGETKVLRVASAGYRRSVPVTSTSKPAALSRRARRRWRRRHLGRIGLDLVPTRLSPRDQPDMACSRVGDFTGGLAVDFTGVVPLRARTTVKLSQMNGNNG